MNTELIWTSGVPDASSRRGLFLLADDQGAIHLAYGFDNAEWDCDTYTVHRWQVKRWTRVEYPTDSV